MLGMQKTIERLVRELEAERVENARFRRMMEDLLYNLEEENMPSVGTRLQRDEQSIGLLVEDGRVRGGGCRNTQWLLRRRASDKNRDARR